MYNLNVVELPSSKNITKIFFDRFYAKLAKPIVIREAITNWPAFKNWNWDYLKSAIGDKMVPLRKKYSNDTKKFDGDPNKSLQAQSMKFSDYIKLLQSPIEPEVYLSGVSINEYFPELAADIKILPYMVKIKEYKQQLWVGKTGTIAPLHYDIWDNFLCQIQGEKKLILFDVSNIKAINAYSAFSKAPHLSQTIITDNLTTDNFKLSQVPCYFAVLKPGDLLFIPSGWWHQVWTISNSISVNFWWFNYKYILTYSYLRSLPFILRFYKKHQQIQGRAKKVVAV